jgi:hypothetical protein
MSLTQPNFRYERSTYQPTLGKKSLWSQKQRKLKGEKVEISNIKAIVDALQGTDTKSGKNEVLDAMDVSADPNPDSEVNPQPQSFVGSEAALQRAIDAFTEEFTDKGLSPELTSVFGKAFGIRFFLELSPEGTTIFGLDKKEFEAETNFRSIIENKRSYDFENESMEPGEGMETYIEFLTKFLKETSDAGITLDGSERPAILDIKDYTWVDLGKNAGLMSGSPPAMPGGGDAAYTSITYLMLQFLATYWKLEMPEDITSLEDIQEFVRVLAMDFDLGVTLFPYPTVPFDIMELRKIVADAVLGAAGAADDEDDDVEEQAWLRYMHFYRVWWETDFTDDAMEFTSKYNEMY